MSLAMTSSSSYCPFSMADLAAADSGLSFLDSLHNTENLDTVTNPYWLEKCFAIFSLPLPIGPSSAIDGGLYAIFSLGYFHYFFDCQIHICRVLFDSIYIDEN